jgi:SpoVK/Ycf46/Vps4 family AAA+-type ATPase
MPKGVKSSDSAYKDHLNFVEDHLKRLELRLRALIIRRRQDMAELGGGRSAAVVDWIDTDPDALENDAAALEKSIAAKLKSSDRKQCTMPLMDIVERFELDAFERDVLLLALAPSLDLRFGRYFGMLRDDPFKALLDVDLALGLMTDDLAERIRLRRYFAADAPLVSNNLIALDRHRLELGDSFLSLGIRLPHRVLGWLLGDGNLDETLRGFSKMIEPTVTLDQVVLKPEVRSSLLTMIQNHAEYLETIKDWKLDQTISYGRGIVLLFVGPPGTGKTMTAKAIANHLGKRLLLVDPQQIFDLKRPVEDNLADLFREARLQNAIVFFDECEGILSHRQLGNPQLSLILSAIEHYDGVIILSTNQPEVLDGALDRRVLYRVGFDPPSVSLRKLIWEVHLSPNIPTTDDVNCAELAHKFEFTGGYIKNAILVALNRALMRPERPVQLTGEDLTVAARSQLRSRLAEYAERHVTPLRIEDLILPEDTDTQVREILDAARSRSIVFQEWGFDRKFSKGRGLSALFDGEPGTGKTLCAEILAAELGLTLYRIQIANVVSKYIGETEKNLTRIFKEATDGHCVLLFDEADSLFSQRTDVKSVHDKYSNMEINVLLQLMERYEGLVLLTTNLKKGIDKAFERRLSFKISFPFPERSHREKIWMHLLPDAAPVADDIEFDILASSFELSGGSIKNAVIRAAYRAAARSSPISMDDLLEAAKRECAAAGKLYRVINRNDDY